MAFFDEIGKKISQTGQDVVQKTKDTAEVLRLNNAISDEEKRIQSLYTEIGKRYAELHAEDCEEALKEWVEGIKSANAAIAAHNEQIKRLKGIIPCPTCGADLPEGATFCTQCGTRIAPVTPPPAPANAGSCCVNCGQALTPGAVFCTACGTKAAAPAPAPAPAGKICPNCGNAVAPNMAFCTQCGTKV